MGSAYSIFGVYFVPFMVCLYGSFVCLLVRGKEIQLSRRKRFPLEKSHSIQIQVDQAFYVLVSWYFVGSWIKVSTARFLHKILRVLS